MSYNLEWMDYIASFYFISYLTFSEGKTTKLTYRPQAIFSVYDVKLRRKIKLKIRNLEYITRDTPSTLA